MNIVTKIQKHKWHYSYVDLSFLFLRVYLEFGSETLDTYHVNPHIYFRIFQHLEIRIFRCGSMVSCDMWDHVIFPR
jgi:hypothetical protein